VKFKFHNYEHSENEVNISSFTQQRQYSPRNRMVFIRKTMTVEGHLCVAGQSAIKAAIDAMEDVYNAEWHTVGLYHDDGTPSAHVLDFNTSLNGIRLLTHDYVSDDGGEYATGRSYRAVFQADYLPNQGTESEIYSWEETITVVGSGGMDWEYIPQLVGDPIKQINFQRTPQQVIQAGESVGVDGYIEPPSSYWPYQCHDNRSLIERGTCQRKGRNWSLLWPTKWRYYHSFLPFNTPSGGLFPPDV
jgi:hypothetical protein